jgi:hypothetical protein
MPLEQLICHTAPTFDGTRSLDLAPITTMALKELGCDFQPERDTELLRSIKTMERINHEAAGDFWSKVDARRAAFEQWRAGVARMSPQQQLDAVVLRLKEGNAGFDGKLTPTIEKEVVIGLELISDDVADIAPLRALEGLRKLRCAGSEPGKGKLTNLWPLKGLALISLDVSNNPDLADLAPVAGTKLTHLYFHATKVDDLAPTKNLPLEELGGPILMQRAGPLLKGIATLRTINGQPAATVLQAATSKP